MRKRLTAAEIWTAPALLGGLSGLGLTTALFSDSLGDLVAWLALSAPVAVVIWHTWRRPGIATAENNTARRISADPGTADPR